MMSGTTREATRRSAAEPGYRGDRAGSGSGLEADLVAEGLELVEVGAFLALGIDPLVIEVGSQVVVAGGGSDSRCQMITRMERPIAFFLPRRRAMRPARAMTV